MNDEAILSSVYLFAELEAAQLARMRQSTHRLSLNDGEHLFEWRDEARRFFLVVNGQILLKRVTPDGQEKVIEIVRSGQTFAEAVMFMDVQTYPVTAVASGPTELLAFNNHVFKGLLVDSPETRFSSAR